MDEEVTSAAATRGWRWRPVFRLAQGPAAGS